MDQIALLTPPDITPAFAITLVLLSFFTSALTAALGLGGGLVLLAVMASTMPLSVLIPIHGVVQLGANTGRAVVQVRHTVWWIVGWIVLGSVFGAWIGGHIVLNLPDAPLKVALALFLLWSIWGRMPNFDRMPRWMLAIAGLAASILMMFFGVTGPFVASIVRPLTKSRLAYAGTQAACMTVQHTLKVVVFGLLGFAFGPWLPLLVAMLVTGLLGTLAGSMLLGRMREPTFKIVFQISMTLLSCELLLQVAGIHLF